MGATPLPLPFDEFSRRFLRLYEPPLRARSTRAKARQVLREFAQLDGVATVADLTTDAVARYLAARGPAANVNSTISRLRVLKTASLYAAAEGWVERPPQWRRLLPRAAPAARKRHLDFDQVVAMLAHLRSRAGDWKGHRLFALAATIAYTGLRAGEACRLHLIDVDAPAGLLHVVARHGSRLKTLGSAAPIGLPPELAEVLAAWTPHAGPTWLFPGARREGPWLGGAPGYRSMDRLRQAGEAIGIEGLTWHALRHTLAKLMVGRFGCSAEQAKTQLRHDDVRTTEDHYLHRDDAALLRAIAARISFRPGPG